MIRAAALAAVLVLGGCDYQNNDQRIEAYRKCAAAGMAVDVARSSWDSSPVVRCVPPEQRRP